MTRTSTEALRLSPSKISVFKDCPRCFWMAEKGGVARVRGIFPSLPGGMDRVLKDHYDKARKVGALPAEILGKVPGKLFGDVKKLDRLRNWRTGFTTVVEGVDIIGAVDDLLEINGKFAPLDYKTRGSAPKEGASAGYYGHQMDIYDLLLSENGMKTTGDAYLVYYFPAEYPKFHTEVVTLKSSADLARDLISRAAECFDRKTPPDASSGCEYCSFVKAAGNYL